MFHANLGTAWFKIHKQGKGSKAKLYNESIKIKI